MSYNDSLHKTELAFTSALSTVASAQGLAQRSGLDVGNKDKKSLTVTAESANPIEETSNNANRQVMVAVVVKTNMDETTAAQHRLLCQEVFDVLFDTEIEATLSAALADFTCFHVEQMGEQQTSVDRSHETQSRFLCHVAPSDIS